MCPRQAITGEQQAAIARLKALMEKLSSLKRSPSTWDDYEAEKRAVGADPSDNALNAAQLNNYMKFLNSMKNE